MTQVDPNLKQQMASNPLSSVWVGASAGTGKTKVLVDRLLRLLLPRQTETGAIKDGTPPTKILCLTFTKAAASEMANRINEKLSQWTVMNDTDLTKALFELTGQQPNDIIRDAGRRLFAQVIDAPGGMKIMTLHSFCQSVLSRFPLESGLTPGFKVADDSQAQGLMNQAVQHLITHPNKQTEDALNYFITELDRNRFNDVLQELVRKRRRISYLLKIHGGLDGLIHYLYNQHDLTPQTTKDSLIKSYQPNKNTLRQAVEVLLSGTAKTDQPKGKTILEWLNDKKDFNNFVQVFLTGQFEPRKKILTAALQKKYPDISSALLEEQHKIFTLFQRIKLLETLDATKMMLTISTAIIDKYTALKKQQSLLDYDDQINMTAELLSRDQAPQWVLFKLDNGIDHILVDEAQDTSPQQWLIVKKLTEEFFQGLGTRQDDVIRTIFAVGDEKQSIYSFQDADPKLFLEMASYFKGLVKQAEQQWQNVAMDVNFRSSPAVLNGVDHVLKNDALRLSVSLKDTPIQHIPYHGSRPGLVEIWPPYELEEKQIGDLFHLPVTRIPQSNPMILLCQKIAQTIDTWLKEKRMLPSYDRPVQAGDIMILLQSRRPMMDALIKACKDHNIPVTGTDRMTLTDQLVVKDILSAIEFCLLPSDDLTTASLLKSPLIGMNEDDLFDLSHNRGDQSLWEVIQVKKEHYLKTYTYLKSIIDLSNQVKPFDFISSLLIQPCPNHTESGRQGFFSRLGMEVKDPLDELLNAAQNFEKNNPPSLQGFIHWLTTTDMEIKRELSSSENQVRIMTVHGSKGLQAPIVIMPDAFKTPSAGNKNLSFYWPQSIEDPFLWANGDSAKNPIIQGIKENNKVNSYNEYYRLLYVAMTRAEDELYVAGWTKTQSKNNESWYAHIKNSWQGIAEEIPLEDSNKIALRYQFKGHGKVKKKENTQNISPVNISDYPWVKKPAPLDPERPTPLTPSKPVVKKSAVQSPLDRKSTGSYWRGSLIHKILQTLPNVEKNQHDDVLKKYLSQAHLKLSPDEQDQLKKEILLVINHPDYAAIFSEKAQAEVPIVGEIKLAGKNVAISGQIDRLLIDKNSIWVVDYKTNRPPPSQLKDVPKDYLYQMGAYHALLKNIYPSHTIHCVLLWTHIPLWMELPIELIEKRLSDKDKK